MGWYEDQVNQRRESDQQMLEESFVRISSVVLGHKQADQKRDNRIITKSAIEEILKYYRYKKVNIPDIVTEEDEQLEYCLRPHSIMRRPVKLEQGWYRDAFGPMITHRKEDGTAVALIPEPVRGYWYRDAQTGRRVIITSKNADQFESEAICFYRALPQKQLGIKDLMVFLHYSITRDDVIRIMLATLVITSVGMLSPRVTKALTGPILNAGKLSALNGVLIALVTFALAAKLVGLIKNSLTRRIESKTTISVQAAMIIRMISLPTRFFSRFSAGELKQRILSVNSLCSMLVSLVLGFGFTTISSMMYIVQIFKFAPALALPAIITILVTVTFSLVVTMQQIKISKKQMEFEAVESGMSYSIISGIQKIRLSGSEKRVFARWLNAYTDGTELAYNPPLFMKVSGVINMAISLFSTIILYDLSVRNGMDTSAYYAFSASYGMVMAAFSSVADIITSAAKIKPILELAEPFLKEVPETSEDKEPVTQISGQIEINHLTFRYDEETPYILKDLSLKINPGEYIAIVGRTGCGKSTLIRLLLGFEQPETGSIFYDGKDLSNLDLSSLRRRIGTVLQSDGLFQGDIYSNIVITAPHLTMKEAWEAAETAGIANDIRAMPMGMATMISEGQGGISGGQRQRLMIARAIAPKPKILIFDEATSALDNKTQRQVSEALDRMGCTRIVIAHRLSTIRHCDRILVLDGGSIVEDGTYDELISKGGYFAELVERQRLDTEEAEG